MVAATYKCLATRDPVGKKRRRWLDALLEVDGEGQARLFKADESNGAVKGPMLCAVQLKLGAVRPGEEIELESGWSCEVEEAVPPQQSSVAPPALSRPQPCLPPPPQQQPSYHHTAPRAAEMSSLSAASHGPHHRTRVLDRTTPELISLAQDEHKPIAQAHQSMRKRYRTDAEILADFFGEVAG